MNIHPLALVSPAAQIGPGVRIGPFCVVEDDVVIGAGCQLASHVVVKDGTRLGPNNIVHEGAVLGGVPQHINKPKNPGRLLIGDGNTIREHVTMHRAIKAEAATCVGNHNFIMAGVHFAHRLQRRQQCDLRQQRAAGGPCDGRRPRSSSPAR